MNELFNTEELELSAKLARWDMADDSVSDEDDFDANVELADNRRRW